MEISVNGKSVKYFIDHGSISRVIEIEFTDHSGVMVRFYDAIGDRKIPFKVSLLELESFIKDAGSRLAGKEVAVDFGLLDNLTG